MALTVPAPTPVAVPVATEERASAAVAAVTAITMAIPASVAAPRATLADGAATVAIPEVVSLQTVPGAACAPLAVADKVTALERVDGRPSLLAICHPLLQTLVVGAVQVPARSSGRHILPRADARVAIVVEVMAERVAERANPCNAAEVPPGCPEIGEATGSLAGATVVVVTAKRAFIGVASGASRPGPDGATLLREVGRRGRTVGGAITVTAPEGAEVAPAYIVAGLRVITTAGRGRALGPPVGRRRDRERLRVGILRLLGRLWLLPRTAPIDHAENNVGRLKLVLTEL